jgi:hypothetical protein
MKKKLAFLCVLASSLILLAPDLEAASKSTQGSCCICVLGTSGGKRVWLCSCFFSEGGNSCTINAFGCTVNGICE